MSHILSTASEKVIAEDVKAAIVGLAKGMQPARTPIMRTPADHGLAYEDIFFQALDGVPLEGWFIPVDSDKLVIFNHPGTFNRYGFPGHLEPWSQVNDFEVNFIKIHEALHKVGYNVLAFDMRNHGLSGSANNGIMAYGEYEWKDMAGAMVYVRDNDRFKNMQVALFSPCAGGNSTLKAMTIRPDLFDHVKALVLPQPCTAGIALKKIAGFQGIEEYMDELDLEQRKLGAPAMEQMSPHHYAKNVKVPTFIIQVKDDVITDPIDVQTTFDLIPGEDKKLFWIEGTIRRFDGYNYFGDYPEQMIEFYNKYVK